MIIIDSNAWIFAENENSDEHDIAAKKITEVLASDGFGINVIITSEVFHILSKMLGAEEASSRMGNIIRHPLAQWLEISDDIALKAIAVSKREHVRINDALIAEQAIRLRAKLLTDNIRDFKKIKGLEIVPIRSELEK